MAQRVGRGITLFFFFHDRGTRRGEWSAAGPGRTLPPGKSRYPFYRRLGGPQGRSGRAENTQKCTITPRGSAPNHSTPLHQHPSLDMTLRYFRPNPFLPFTLSPKNPFYFCPPKFCFIVTQLVYPKGFLCKTFHAFPPSSHSPAQPILGPPPPYFIILTRLGDINLIMMCGKQMTLLNNQ